MKIALNMRSWILERRPGQIQKMEVDDRASWLNEWPDQWVTTSRDWYWRSICSKRTSLWRSEDDRNVRNCTEEKRGETQELEFLNISNHSVPCKAATLFLQASRVNFALPNINVITKLASPGASSLPGYLTIKINVNLKGPSIVSFFPRGAV